MKYITPKFMANSALKGPSFVAFSSNMFSYLFNSISRSKIHNFNYLLNLNYFSSATLCW